MQPCMAVGNQVRERVEPIRHGTAGDSSAALVDQLVLEFLCMELNEPPAAQLAKQAGDGAQLQFISSMFDSNPILEQLAASAVFQIGATTRRSLSNQHENREESTIPVERTQQLRLLFLIREVLERRNILAKQYRSIQTSTTHTALQKEMKPTSISGQCEYCGYKKQIRYHTNVMQNMSNGQNPRGLVTQHESELTSVPSKVSTTPAAGQQRQIVRTSKITEKATESCVTMSVKVYIPSPPPGVKCSYIGRLIGPNGITIRELQLETRCHIAVRGRGSIKGNKLFRKMRYKPGFGHLKEDTHVLVEAKASSRTECRSLIEKAMTRISEMFTPEFDALKREQLIHLAMLNGTYRQSMPST
uniref:KH domain-containing protein n=1 Tax=Angiostrongylus cantonensis TaxID=6313 RepID=A0A0K0D538_ANGCA